MLFSLIAEPLTGLVDTAFIARLGSGHLAALGVGTTVLSSIFWIFNFLGIGVQTEVAQAAGRQDTEHAARINTLAILLSAASGILITIIGHLLTEPITVLLGANDALRSHAIRYIDIRWFGAPAVLITLTAFGALRGLQDMRNPLWIALVVNAVNIILDPILIFGYGPFPAFGIAGAAIASVISQWIGAAWAVAAVSRQVGFDRNIRLQDTTNLMKIGGDLFIRTGLLNLFFILTTRAATRIGAESGAAHQAIRQVWMFSTLVLDAFALTGQSLVGFYFTPENLHIARRVASTVCLWCVASSVVLSGVMWLGTDLVRAVLVPPGAVSVFFFPWFVVIMLQPVNAIAFATDGVHWGTGDFRYLRNAVMIATGLGTMGIAMIDESHPDALALVWVVAAAWISIRALFGILRIWPGIGKSPLSLSHGD